MVGWGLVSQGTEGQHSPDGNKSTLYLTLSPLQLETAAQQPW